MNVKRRLQRGLALLLTLCLLSGNLAFAEELPAPSSEPVVEESVQNEETLPAENEAEVPDKNEENLPTEAEVSKENEAEVPEANAENAPAEDEDKLEISPEDAPEALTEGAPEEGEYLFNFTFHRLPFGPFGNMDSIYEDYWKTQPPEGNLVYDFENNGLKNFEIEYELHIEGSQSIKKAAQCYGFFISWEDNVSFNAVTLPYNNIEVVYYPADEGKWVEPYLLHYDLQLEKGEGKMILKVPKLPSKGPVTPEGNRQVISVEYTVQDTSILYLNGTDGNDKNAGISQDQAVKTFERALAIAKANQKIKTIMVTGKTQLTGKISLEGTSAKIKRGDDYKDYLFYVPEDEKVSLSDIVIDGNATLDENADKKIKQSLIEVKPKAILEIKDGAVLRNNAIMRTYSYKTWGGAIYADQATVVMTGGVVEGNQATYGGGIYLSHSTLEFSGGTVQDNHSLLVMDFENDIYYSAGGGICADKGSTIYLSGNAQILNNHAAEIGGGISLGTDVREEGNALYMKGGTIDGNTAGSGGGGIFVQCRYDNSSGSESKAFIGAGQITNNKMTGTGDNEMRFGGGGIYVNGSRYGKNGELHLKNAVITGNTAKGTKIYRGYTKPDAGSGGGYAACPVTKTTIYVTDGVAIYKNTARTNGNDLYILASVHYDIHSGEPKYDLSERMLGGALWDWRYDREIGVYHVDDRLPADLYRRTLNHKNDNAELPLLTPFEENEWVNALAKVWITGNTSETRGGGIGSNGTVIFGTEGDTTDISVEKKWDDNNNAKKKRPDSITVELIATYDDQEHVVETRVLNAENDWKTTFKGLPTVNAEKKITYKIKEIAVAGYKTTITDNGKGGFIITNTPETPPPTPREKTVEIPVEKIWKDNGHEDKRPTEITVTLYADGVATDKTLILNAKNEWKGVFRNLPEKKDGKIITYTVKEVEVKGYESVRTGNMHDGFTLTNTYKPEKPPTPPTPPKPPIPAIPFVRIPRAGA